MWWPSRLNSLEGFLICGCDTVTQGQQQAPKTVAVACGTRLRPHSKQAIWACGLIKGTERTFQVKHPQWEIQSLTALMHKQAAQHTTLYKRHAAHDGPNIMQNLWRGGRVGYCVRLESGRSSWGDPWVRIPPSPPLWSSLGLAPKPHWRCGVTHLEWEVRCLRIPPNFRVDSQPGMLYYETHGRVAKLMHQCATLETGGSSPSPSSKFLRRYTSKEGARTVNSVV